MIYRNAFTNQYAWEDRDVWARQLKGVTMTQLEAGFAGLRGDDRFETFPPNPIEFYHLCLGKDRPQLDSDGNDATWQHKRIESADRDYNAPRLNHGKINSNAAQEGLDALRKMRAELEAESL